MTKNILTNKILMPLAFFVVFLFLATFLFPREIKAQSPPYTCETNKEGLKLTDASFDCRSDVYECGKEVRNCYCGKADSKHLCCIYQDVSHWVCIDKTTGLKAGSTGAPTDATYVSPSYIEGQAAIKKTIWFKPNITLPGSKFIAGKAVAVTGDTLGEWIAAFYAFFCTVVGILAFANILFGGFRYVTSFGNPSRMQAAKDRITAALVGILLTLGAYIFLLTISPNLVKFKTIKLEEIKELGWEGFETELEPPESYGRGQECLFQAYGSTKQQVEEKLDTINFRGHDVRVHKLAKTAFLAVDKEIADRNLSYNFDSVGTFNWRSAVGIFGKMSLHSFGIAMDINPKRNPYCQKDNEGLWNYYGNYPNLTDEEREKCKNGELVTDFKDYDSNGKPDIPEIFEKHGFYWGGKWNSMKDAMHFEWHCNCYTGKDIEAICGTGPDSCNCTECNTNSGIDCTKEQCASCPKCNWQLILPSYPGHETYECATGPNTSPPAGCANNQCGYMGDCYDDGDCYPTNNGKKCDGVTQTWTANSCGDSPDPPNLPEFCDNCGEVDCGKDCCGAGQCYWSINLSCTNGGDCRPGGGVLKCDGITQTWADSCGDGTCNCGETIISCPDDCAGICGNGVQEAGEECDDGNASNNDACLNSCQNAECGDGYTWTDWEQCDDGNNTDCDGCSSACKTETGCGDGVKCGLEECDDENLADCDGCSHTCKTDRCGDNAVCGLEECDDGNAVGCDGCSATCIIETGCGDNICCENTCTCLADCPCASGGCFDPALCGATCCCSNNGCYPNQSGANLGKWCSGGSWTGSCPDGQCKCGETVANCAADCLVCGDGNITPPEECEPGPPEQLNGKTCVTQGFDCGTLHCKPKGVPGECTFDTSSCTKKNCANAIIECNEPCSDGNLNGKTCGTQGFYCGKLQCNATCTGFDTNFCFNGSCGDGILQKQCTGYNGCTEDCDGNYINHCGFYYRQCYKPTGCLNCQCQNQLVCDGSTCAKGNLEWCAYCGESCGDGLCMGEDNCFENQANCPADCNCKATQCSWNDGYYGNVCLDQGQSKPDDFDKFCKAGAWVNRSCGDGFCTGGETPASCPGDCPDNQIGGLFRQDFELNEFGCNSIISDNPYEDPYRVLKDTVMNYYCDHSFVTPVVSSQLVYYLGFGYYNDKGIRCIYRIWTGEIKADNNQNITFYIHRNDGARLYIDANDDGDFGDAGETVINNWWEHPGMGNQGTIFLNAGWHKIQIEWFSSASGGSFQIGWRPGGGNAYAQVFGGVTDNCTCVSYQIRDIPPINYFIPGDHLRT